MIDKDDYDARVAKEQDEQAAAMAAHSAQTRVDAALADAREKAAFFTQTGLKGIEARDALNALYPIEPAAPPVTETAQVQKESSDHA